MGENVFQETTGASHSVGGQPVTATPQPAVRPIRSALFVDFDNIFSSLCYEVDERTALSFANNPARWLAWLEQQPPKYSPYDLLINFEGETPASTLGRTVRRLLWRRVYMNPDRYRHFRGSLVAAGIEVIDCPVLTGHGKTAADMIMAIGILDALKQDPPVEEFIILAADADYTPVVQRLRQNDRRSIILPIGGVSPAYKNAADQVLDANKFMDFLLPESRSNQTPSTQTTPPQEENYSSGGREETAVNFSSDGQSKREQIRLFLRELLQTYQGRIDLTVAGQQILEKFGRYPDGDGLKVMLSKIADDDLQVAHDEQKRFFVYNPALYNINDDIPKGNFNIDKLSFDRPELATLVRRITSGTGAPELNAEQYTLLFRAIAEEINANGYNFNHTSRGARDRCRLTDCPAARSEVTYALRCLYHGNHDFNTIQHEANVAQSFKSSLLTYCKRNQIEFTDDEIVLFHEWIQTEEANDGLPLV